MPEKPRKEFPVVSDEGLEGTVLGYVKDGVEQPWVIKKLDKFSATHEGIPRHKASELILRYRRLQQQYGEVMPYQRLVSRNDRARQVRGYAENFFILQERFTFADPADIYNYGIDDVPDQIKPALATLAEQMLDSYRAYEAGPKRIGRLGTAPGHIPLDLGPGNVMVTDDFQLKYVDSGIGISDYNVLGMMDTTLHDVHSRIAHMELLAGTSVEEVLGKADYAELWERILDDQGVEVAELISQPDEIIRVLKEFFASHPFRQQQKDSILQPWNTPNTMAPT